MRWIHPAWPAPGGALAALKLGELWEVISALSEVAVTAVTNDDQSQAMTRERHKHRPMLGRWRGAGCEPLSQRCSLLPERYQLVRQVGAVPTAHAPSPSEAGRPLSIPVFAIAANGLAG